MKISIVTLTFPPEPAQHVLDLAMKLSQNHEVTVLTSLPSYPYGRIYKGYRKRLFVVEHSNGIKIVRVPVIPSQTRSFLRRGLYYLSNCIFTFLYELFAFHKADIAIIYHPPLTTAIAGMWLKWFGGAAIVYWIHDLWPETLEQGGVRNRRVLYIINEVAKYFYKRAAKIIVLSPGFKNNLIRKGILENNIEVIPNWASPNGRDLADSEKVTTRKLDMPPGCFYILYAGNLGEMQGLDAVIRAMTYLIHLPSIRLVFLGTGTRHDELVALTRALGLEQQVKFLGRVTPDEVSEYYTLADVLLLHIRDTSLFAITVPHKIYEYMMAGKPIVTAARGDARDEVMTTGAGIDCEPENPQSIAAAIEAFYQMAPEKRIAMGFRGRQFVLDNRTPQILIGRIEKILSL
jgi:colanic acid biosynthesis glycosyl transferase WcaI